ncbi:MAG: NADH-quinone oxidoreductase subunit A [Muribaculaceae bacterium]|nr:NADH-quinone oxidoreductase subunit A [Muribaculaceae bacterium]MBO7382378.1 NADH-quinone oxidoreductase subunit A [Muribaculaceae bacterium]MBP5316005.1 NADH-quinone oxidoreductase subunit A [Muribaculaceae bacterium]MBR5435872.1 NADH-quinone oxidoreductase subunit A [Muribaculaceae bacterium]
MEFLTIQPSTMAVTALLTGVTLVFAGLLVAKLMAPRSFNPQKGEPYECGIPTRGESMAQFRVGYYLYAILFLMFDVETVFLYPWAVNAKQWAAEYGPSSITAVAVFFAILVLGLAYAWRKGALKWE